MYCLFLNSVINKVCLLLLFILLNLVNDMCSKELKINEFYFLIKYSYI